MFDIVHRVGVKAPVSKVYAALATPEGVASWWTREASGESRPGGALTFTFRTPGGDVLGVMEMEVLELSPNEKVRWRVRSGPPEWIGTEVSFTLAQQREYTTVQFGHRNWREEVEFTAHCSTKWATFLLSLKDLLEKGKGRPAPDDLKIDDWN